MDHSCALSNWPAAVAAVGIAFAFFGFLAAWIWAAAWSDRSGS